MNRRLVLMAVLAATASICRADSIVASSSGGWQSWTLKDLNEDGSPYWDHTSYDGSHKNVGYCLTGTGNCSFAGAPNAALPYYGQANGSAVTNFYFHRDAAAESAVLDLEVAGNANINEIGWYSLGNPTTLHAIFVGPDSASAQTTFQPSLDYGFYLKSGSQVFYTQSQYNAPSETSHQHFAVFASSLTPGSEAYYFGSEDLPNPTDNDYNDMVIKVASTPEPGSFALLGVTLIGGVLMMRRAQARG